jgi:hypothetical protein
VLQAVNAFAASQVVTTVVRSWLHELQSLLWALAFVYWSLRVYLVALQLSCSHALVLSVSSDMIIVQLAAVLCVRQQCCV